MGDRFRSMIESEFAEVDSPPIGDLVDNAIRDGRRLRRTRMVQRSVACFAAVGVLALGVGMATSSLRPDGSPGSDGVAAPPATAGPATTAPYVSAEPTVDRSGRRSQMPPDTPTMAVFPAGRPDGVESQPPTAPPAAVLMALGSTLPNGPTIAFAGSRFDTFTGVQVFLDRGAGFGMIRVAMARYDNKRSCSRSAPGVAVSSCTDEKGALVETFEIESNCVQRRGVNVYRSDGIAIQVNIGSCLADGDWGAAMAKIAVDEEVLAVAEAVQIGLSPVWDERTMIETAAKAKDLYPALPLLTSFDGVGP
ncbi:hypothetical protein [Virgisporangium aurantiacum]|uniref:Uncharacterized protein n=1 Tax=Virgisporangium aurantiacum TaxID=175570 RepID=A0A8J4E7T6_9ACTN|nr:hypothetical protein [Virgisporangium aurantiacum]GIJ64543.1 hypothetical protein Vau01_120590 [Virgisporangium aurantiacum]